MVLKPPDEDAPIPHLTNSCSVKQRTFGARKQSSWFGRCLQQLLREWESNVLAKPTSSPHYKPARARPKLEDLEPAREQPAEILFVPCPCDGCEFRGRCAAGLACERLAIFLDGKGQKHWRAAACEPTQARFEALLGWDPVTVIYIASGRRPFRQLGGNRARPIALPNSVPSAISAALRTPTYCLKHPPKDGPAVP